MISHAKKILNPDYLRIKIKNQLDFLKLKKERIGKYIFEYPHRPYFHGGFHEIFIDENYKIDGIYSCKNIIDVGSNIGLSVAYFAREYPQAHITSFEPNPETLPFLKTNIERNHLPVTVQPFALGKEEKEVTFYTDAGIEGSSSAGTVQFVHSKNRPVKETRVQMKRLSDFIIERVDILKIDAEGAEMDILEDLVTSKKINQVQNLFAEFHYDPKLLPQSLSTFLKILETEGFFYYIRKGVVHQKRTAMLHSYIVFAFRNA